MWLSMASAALVLSANPYLEDAKHLIDSLHYPEAEAKLRTASQVPTNTPEERRQVYDLLVRAVVAQGRLAEAETLYSELLAADPEATAPKAVSPKIREAFIHAKHRVYPPDFVKLQQLPSPPGRLAMRLVDPWDSIVEVRLAQRERPAPFSTRTLTGEGGQYAVDLPTPGPGTSSDFYVDAVAADGRVLASVASAEHPLTLAGPPVARPLPSGATPGLAAADERVDTGPPKWPKWVVGGAAVVALGVGTGFGVASYRDSKAAGAPSIPSKDLRALDASARQKAWVANACIGGALLAGAGAVVLAWKW